MAFAKDVRQQIDDLVKKNRFVLFMKGNRQLSQCGLSAKVVGSTNWSSAFGRWNALRPHDRAERAAVREATHFRLPLKALCTT